MIREEVSRDDCGNDCRAGGCHGGSAGRAAAGVSLPDADLLGPFGAPADDTGEIWNVNSAFAALPT
jgi:hypothetical protein